MKLLLVIVEDADAAKLRQALIENGIRSTKLSSTGGFLRQGNTTLIIGVDNHQVARVKAVIEMTCRERSKTLLPSPSLDDITGAYLGQPMEVTVGGAIVFVLEVEEFVRL